MPNALDALHAKAVAFDGVHSEEWARWSEGYIRSLKGEQPGVVGATHLVDTSSTALTARLTRELDLAETFYVSPEMNKLVTAAAESWEEDEIVHMEDFPSFMGWMWIPGGVSKLDLRGRLITTKAVSWHVTGGRVILTYWADKNDDDPVQRASLGWGGLPQFTPWHVLVQPLGKQVVKGVGLGTALPPEISDQIYWTQTEQGLMAYFPEGWTKEQMTPRLMTEPVLTWLVSALRIMQTPIADVRRQGLPANVRKGLLKRPHRFKEKAVTVIEFRRRKGENILSTEREFSHRWLRRGHWRKQWMGSEKTDDRRQVRIWIHPQVCGPADKPFILRRHVNALIR